MDTQTALQTAGGIILRHGATTAAGFLVAHGIIDGSATEQFVSAVMFLGGVGLSAWNKYGQALVAAELARFKARGAAPLTAAAVQRQMDARSSAMMKNP